MIFMRRVFGHRPSLALPRRPWAIVAVLVALQAALLAADVSGDLAFVKGLLLGTPALAAVVLAPRHLLVIVVTTVLAVTEGQKLNGDWGTKDSTADIIGSALIGVIALVVSALRTRRERKLTQSRRVAEAAQRVLLRPLPPRLGSLAISSLYLAADEESSVGGDLYAAALVDDVPRVMVGDAQGKGTSATELASYLFGAFRRAAREGAPLRTLPEYLDTCLREELADRAVWEARTSEGTEDAQRLLEGFVTAAVVDVTDHGIDIVNCGHPSPLLIREGKVHELAATVCAPPLGLGVGPTAWHVDRFDFEPGDLLLLYTDGVTEARDRRGTFYPLADRLAGWAGLTPPDLLAALRADLTRHAAGRLADDVVAVAIRHTV